MHHHPLKQKLLLTLTVEEIITVLRLLWKGKIPENDGISVKLLQLRGFTVVEIMKKLADQIWKESVLAGWQKQLVIPTFKNKGYGDHCYNYLTDLPAECYQQNDRLNHPNLHIVSSRVLAQLKSV